MKTPKRLLALLLGLCLVCANGTLYADDDNGTAETTVGVKTGNEAPAAGQAATETAPAAATEVGNGGEAVAANATETETKKETPAAATEVGNEGEAVAANATEAEAKKETPAAATEAGADDEKTAAAPATITEKPAPGAAHPQEISIIPFKGYDLDGKRVDVGACIGEKPVLLVFWASWCPTCKSEVPHLNALADRFGDRMAVVGVNIAENDTYKRAKAFAARTDMHYPTIYDASRLLAWQYAIRGLPTVVVADKKGIIRYYGPGAPEITDEVFAKLTAD